MKDNQQFAKSGAVILVGLILLLGIVVNILRPKQSADNWPEERPFYQVVKENNLKELWSLENIFAIPNDNCCPRMAAATGKLFLDGVFGQPGKTQILAFNGRDGALLWQSSNSLQSVTTLQATSKFLYAGFNANGPVRAYDLETGKILWSNTMPGEGAFPPRYTRRLRIDDDMNMIYLEATSTLHFIQADTGEVLKTLSRPFRDKDVQKAALELAQTLGIVVEPQYFWRDVITKDTEFINLESGELQAYDRQTNHLLWNIEGVICNVVTTESAVYFLTKERKLLGADPRTGNIISSAQFERIEPDNYIPSSQGPATSCYLAADEHNNLIYVFWGAGAQLFAFKVIE